jgi:diguanylate cyclase (GGDEF)-like protein/PAS domain S-box-containing protein
LYTIFPYSNTLEATPGKPSCTFLFVFAIFAMNDVNPKNNIEVTAYAEQRFREFADAMPHILWTAQSDGQVNYANTTYFDYTGLSPEEVTQNWLSVLHPEDIDRTKAAWNNAIATGSVYLTEFRIFHKPSGQYRWHAVTAKPIKNKAGEIEKWYGTCTDIHESKENSERAALIAKRLDATLESLTDGFVMLDQEWRVIYINTATEKGLQRSRFELTGKVWWEEFPEMVDSEVYQKSRHVAAERQPIRFEYNFPTFSCWFDVGIYPSEEGISMYFRDITKRKQAEEHIQRLAFYDQLTGLPNRQLLQDRLNHLIPALGRSRRHGAFLFIDLDNFKAVNDVRGHRKGDVLLEEAAQRLKTFVRQNDTAARIGPDQFVVVLEELSSRVKEATTQVRLVGERLLAALGQPYKIDDIDHIITASIGITVFDGSTEDINALYRQADMAMSRAKSAGRNTVRFYDPVMQIAIDEKLSLESDLREAIEKKMLTLYYQPQVDRSGRITGAEGLLRWKHSIRGDVSPSAFIPLAEETGMILPLGHWTIETACYQLTEWAREASTAHLTLSVNVSARQFRHPDFVNDVREVVRQSGIDATKLKLELTESLFVEDVEEAIGKMVVLKALGIGFSLDDFGTGYSSLSYLRSMPLEQLKIDKSFIDDVPDNENDVSIVEAIIALGRRLGMNVIAEGVETVQQVKFLAGAGCNGYQGYLFCKPLNAQDFRTYIGNRKIT